MTADSRAAGPGARRRRWLLAAGAVGAWLVTAVFVLIGDGVEPSGTGATRAVIEYGHQLVWVLLAVALTWAALRGRWQRLSGVLAVAALVVYVLFVLAVLTAD